MTRDLLLRNVEIEGRSGLDVRVGDGRVVEIGPGLQRAGAEDLDGRGGALIPGLCDHHIHLFGLAARRASVDLQGLDGFDDLRRRLAEAARSRPAGSWIRAIGYHERIAGELSRAQLDDLAPQHPLRVQHQTGALWMMNSAALARLPGPGADPEGLDRSTGRLWRGDAWLKAALGGGELPDFTSIGQDLAAKGVTALTDASVTTNDAAAEALGRAYVDGTLPQRLTLMSGGYLKPSADRSFAIGPVKVLLDDHDLIDLDDFCARIDRARSWGRAVAVHCVSAAELALSLAAFEAAGARPGDRIEHGGLISQAAIAQIRALGLTVVTQSAFILERGDRYLAEVPPAEHDDLYRCASLQRAGITVLGSSDAPYASPDPWRGMAAAVARRTLKGRRIGSDERITPQRALALYLGSPAVRLGQLADLCLLQCSRRAALADLAEVRVTATLVGGRVVHLRR